MNTDIPLNDLEEVIAHAETRSIACLSFKPPTGPRDPDGTDSSRLTVVLEPHDETLGRAVIVEVAFNFDGDTAVVVVTRFDNGTRVDTPDAHDFMGATVINVPI